MDAQCSCNMAFRGSLYLSFFLFLLIITELQWLEHWGLVYHGCFELVLESLGNNPLAADVGTLG